MSADTTHLHYEKLVEISYYVQNSGTLSSRVLIDIYSLSRPGTFLDYLCSLLGESSESDVIIKSSKPLALPHAGLAFELARQKPELFKEVPYGIFFLVKKDDSLIMMSVGLVAEGIASHNHDIHSPRQWPAGAPVLFAVQRHVRVLN